MPSSLKFLFFKPWFLGKLRLTKEEGFLAKVDMFVVNDLSAKFLSFESNGLPVVKKEFVVTRLTELFKLLLEDLPKPLVMTPGMLDGFDLSAELYAED
ncbi:MAG: hypothetical protein O2908_06885 [Verrucomicrobia bacterium]|nr:hypothetical protein [Verrucomicrobiota bacterium]